MAITDKLTNIANAIRFKTGKSNLLTLEDMPTEIRNITSAEALEIQLKSKDYPNYIHPEILKVAQDVREILNEDSIVSICLSDSHYPVDSSTKNGVTHALMAIKALTYLLPIDFIAHLGDVGFEGKINSGSSAYNINLLKNQLLEMTSYIKETGGDSVPLFVAIGNHDTGIYITSEDSSDLVEGDFLFKNLTNLANSENTIFSGQDVGGYCYRDFPEKRVRVFLLNTSELIVSEGRDSGTSEIQRSWIASKLLELNEKTDASDWGFIILCHYPADYGASKTLSNVFEAYVDGKTITLNGTSYDFSSKNNAKFIAQFHGHIHNYLVDKLYGGTIGNRVNGTPSNQYDAYRIAIPNSQTNRENYYYNTDASSTDGTLWGIKFFEGEFNDKGQSAQYKKETGSAKDTSFVINVINPTSEKIYSFSYGAGPEKPREIFYNFNKIKYNITNNLTNISSSNISSIIQEGNTYIAQLSAIGGYSLAHAQVSITMGGTILSNAYNAETGVIKIENINGDIVIKANTEVAEYYTIQRNIQNATSNTDILKIYPSSNGNFTHSETITLIKNNYYFETFTVLMNGQNTGTTYINIVDSQDGNPGYYEINIPNVTGNLEITAIAKKQPTSNLGLFAEDVNSSAIFNNGLGYINNHRLSGGAIGNSSIAAAEGYVTTGFIPWNIEPGVTPETIEIKGVTLDDTDQLCRMYFCDNAKSKNIIPWLHGGEKTDSASPFSSSFTIEELGEKHYKLIPIMHSWGNWVGNQGTYPGAYFRLSLKGTGEDFIVNVGEDSSENIYSIVQTLTNITSNNQQTTIIEGDSLSISLTPKAGYLINNITILMNNIDVTSSYYSNGIISIPEVTGNIIITASADKDSSTPYTNQIPISIGLDKKPYNYPYGYKTGLRLNSSNTEVEISGMCLTGFIPCKIGDVIRIKNVTISGSATPYIIFDRFLSNNSYNSEGVYNTCGSFSTKDLVQDSNGIITVTIPNTMSNVNYLRLSCGTITETSILTINEEITS